MPFTLSHPAAALVLSKSGLPVAATVAGTMAPDVPMFVPGPVGYSVTHSWRGVATVDVLIGAFGVVLWSFLLRDAMADLAPAFIRERVPPTAPYALRQWALAPVAVLVGAATHVGWDAFTHDGRWGVRHLAWLRSEHWGHAGYHWAQAVSTVGGLLVVLLWAFISVTRRPRRPRPSRIGVRARAVWPATFVATGAGGLVAGLIDLGSGVHAAAIAAAVAGTTVLAAVALVVALGWQVLDHRARTDAAAH